MLELARSVWDDRGDNDKFKVLLGLGMTHFRLGPPEAATRWFALAGLLSLIPERTGEALVLVQRAIALEDSFIDNVFAASSDRERLSFSQDVWSNFACIMTIVAGAAADNPGVGAIGFDLVQKRKGLSGEAGAALRAALRLDGEDDGLRTDLDSARMAVALQTTKGPKDQNPDKWSSMLDRLHMEKEWLETDHARRSLHGIVARLGAATWSEAQAALPEDSTLVEYLWIRHVDFTKAYGPDLWGEARYLAFILNKTGHPKLVPLGDAEPIDQAITDSHASITSPHGSRALGRQNSELTESPRDAGQRLRQMVFDPIRESLKGGLLFVAPDGDLAKVPFQTLPGSGEEWLIDSYHIHYLHTGRDLLKWQEPSTAELSAPRPCSRQDWHSQERTPG